eukprot:CAMPEP_0171974740 /NCGR_PEP_ID=MMETSP0993-20121228/233947_1 /TAXON_ID=483369 /ORGANISM="non described non described, Strain CCMP2098" /LENGTH=115 /DNA_ID=CAMNT_0012625833 /DNA_START=1 /DNA_END=349 /DNA_ORIENTATION=+
MPDWQRTCNKQQQPRLILRVHEFQSERVDFADGSVNVPLWPSDTEAETGEVFYYVRRSAMVFVPDHHFDTLLHFALALAGNPQITGRNPKGLRLRHSRILMRLLWRHRLVALKQN